MSDMLNTNEVTEKLEKHLEILRMQYGVERIGLFGSLVRGSQHAESDIDLLVEFKQPVGLFKFIELENQLSDLLGAKVDLVTPNALKPGIGKRILDEVRYVN
jgi:predicted nucleotidyltransferase